MLSIQAQVAKEIRKHLKFMGIEAKVTSGLATHCPFVKIQLSTADINVENYVYEYAKQYKHGSNSDYPKVDYINVSSRAKRPNGLPT